MQIEIRKEISIEEAYESMTASETATMLRLILDSMEGIAVDSQLTDAFSDYGWQKGARK